MGVCRVLSPIREFDRPDTSRMQKNNRELCQNRFEILTVNLKAAFADVIIHTISMKERSYWFKSNLSPSSHLQQNVHYNQIYLKFNAK